MTNFSYDPNQITNSTYRTPLNQNMYSKRHGKYGSTLYAFDVDMVECDIAGNPVMLCELKHGNQIRKPIDCSTYQIQMLQKLNPNLPAFILVYCFMNENGLIINDYDKEKPYIAYIQFYTIALNPKAEELMGANHKLLSEYEWVSILYNSRKEVMPDHIEAMLCKNTCRLPVIPLINNNNHKA